MNEQAVQSESSGVTSLYLTSPELLTLVLTFLAAWGVIQFFRWVKDLRNSPPGPWGYPLVGHLHLMIKDPHLLFTEMRKTYGDVIKIRMGSWPTIIVNGRKAIREALVDRGDDFSSRPCFHTQSILKKDKNAEPTITFEEFDARWVRHRKIANSVLFAFSNAKKNPLEQSIHDEIDNIVEEFQKTGGSPTDPHDVLFMSVGSIIYQICFGRQQQIREDPDFNQFIQTTRDFSRFTAAGNPVDVMPWLRFILPSSVDKFRALIDDGIKGLIKKESEHKGTFDPNNLRDVCDGFINAVNKLTEEDKAVGITEKQLMGTIGNIFGAGFETTSTTLYWCVLFMAKYPDLQAKVHAELDDVIGSSQRPELADKSRLPYTDCVILEVLRYVCTAPFALPHLSMVDSQLCGYRVPKDTVVLLNLYSVCHDPEVWGDPENFRPERFLTSQGHVDKALAEQVMVFSAGRRKCLGEALARAELFLFFAGFMQRLRFLQAPGEEYSLKGKFGLTLMASNYKVVARIRE